MGLTSTTRIPTLESLRSKSCCPETAFGGIQAHLTDTDSERLVAAGVTFLWNVDTPKWALRSNNWPETNDVRVDAFLRKSWHRTWSIKLHPSDPLIVPQGNPAVREGMEPRRKLWSRWISSSADSCPSFSESLPFSSISSHHRIKTIRTLPLERHGDTLHMVWHCSVCIATRCQSWCQPCVFQLPDCQKSCTWDDSSWWTKNYTTVDPKQLVDSRNA